VQKLDQCTCREKKTACRVHKDKYTIHAGDNLTPHRPTFTSHLVSGINFLSLSVNFIPVPLSLMWLFVFLPHLLTKLTTLAIHNSLSPSLPTHDLATSFTNLSRHRLPSGLEINSTYLMTGPFLPSYVLCRRSVCLSVCHTSEPCKSGYTDRDAV